MIAAKSLAALMVAYKDLDASMLGASMATKENGLVIEIESEMRWTKTDLEECVKISSEKFECYRNATVVERSARVCMSVSLTKASILPEEDGSDVQGVAREILVRSQRQHVQFEGIVH